MLYEINLKDYFMIRNLTSAALLILIFCIINQKVNAQTLNSDNQELKNPIKSVENNLRGWTKIKGQPSWTLAERMKYYHVNGISIAVIKDYKIDWAKGYGLADSLSGRPVNAATLFQVGSISKAVNGLGVLSLVQNGKLNLDKDINEYLKSWKFPYDSVSKGKKITLANLLSHTAGLSGHGFPGYAMGDTIPSLIEILNGKPPANTKAIRSEFEPSVKYKYSGGGTTISQLIIQDVVQKPYNYFMRKTIFDPLGMKTSSYEQPPSEANKKLLATGYLTNGKAVVGNYHIYPEQAAAGLWSNPSELAAYVIEIQQSLIGKSNKILSQEMATRYTMPFNSKYVTPYPDEEVALGVYSRKTGNERYFTHDGSDRGFKAKFIGSIKDGYGAVVIINSDSREILEEVVNAIAFTYNWKNFLEPDKTVIKVNDDILNSYVGEYLFENDPMSIIKEGDKLFIKVNKIKMQMWFTSETEFFVFEQKAYSRFLKDAQGKISGFIYKEEVFETTAKKIK
jgi:CubicO group peptidase (beta-lactamase class C family)